MNNHPKPDPIINIKLSGDLKQLPISPVSAEYATNIGVRVPKCKVPCYIYSICDPVRNKHYIGATGDLRSRIRQHRGQLRSGTHSSSKLQEHFNKFGEDLYDSILDGFNKDPISGFGGSFWS